MYRFTHPRVRTLFASCLLALGALGCQDTMQITCTVSPNPETGESTTVYCPRQAPIEVSRPIQTPRAGCTLDLETDQLTCQDTIFDALTGELLEEPEPLGPPTPETTPEPPDTPSARALMQNARFTCQLQGRLIDCGLGGHVTRDEGFDDPTSVTCSSMLLPGWGRRIACATGQGAPLVYTPDGLAPDQLWPECQSLGGWVSCSSGQVFALSEDMPSCTRPTLDPDSSPEAIAACMYDLKPCGAFGSSAECLREQRDAITACANTSSTQLSCDEGDVMTRESDRHVCMLPGGRIELKNAQDHRALYEMGCDELLGDVHIDATSEQPETSQAMWGLEGVEYIHGAVVIEGLVPEDQTSIDHAFSFTTVRAVGADLIVSNAAWSERLSLWPALELVGKRLGFDEVTGARELVPILKARTPRYVLGSLDASNLPELESIELDGGINLVAINLADLPSWDACQMSALITWAVEHHVAWSIERSGAVNEAGEACPTDSPN